MIRIVATQDPAQPGPLFRDGLMPMPPESVLNLHELGPHPLLTGIASELELPVPAGTTDVRETQKGKSLWATLAPAGPIPGGMPPKLDEAGLLRLETQGKRGTGRPEGQGERRR